MGGDAAAAASSQLQPRPVNRDDGKRHKITEQELRRRSLDEDQVNSFKEVNVKKALEDGED